MQLFVHAVRILLGLDFLLNGVNFWFPFIPITAPESEKALALMAGLVESGLFDYVKYIEVATGIMLIFNLFTPLTLVFITPLVAVIFYVDCILIATPEGWLFGGGTALLLLIALVGYMRHYLCLFRMKAAPSTPNFNEMCAAIAGAQL